MSLSSNIRLYRKKAGLTQLNLAEKMGISIATLRRWEAGETAPSGTKIFDLAQILGISPDNIVSAQNKQESAENEQAAGNANTNREINGMLVFDGGGTRIELPPSDKGYELFNKLVENFIKEKSRV